MATNGEGFDFGLLPSLCQNEVFKRASIRDLISMMEDDPQIREQIKNLKIQSGGYHLKFTYDGGIEIPTSNYVWKWQRLDRQFMVDDIINQFVSLKECFPGEVTYMEIEKNYVPAVLNNGKIDEVKSLHISNGYAGDNISENTMERFLQFMKITQKLHYGISHPPLKVQQIKDIPVVNLHYAGWLRFPDFMEMNSSHMDFEQTIYNSAQLNQFLTKWYNSKNPLLTKASFRVAQELNEDVVFRGLYKKQWDPENKNRTDYPGMPPAIASIEDSPDPRLIFWVKFFHRNVNDDFELRRPDGLLASISLKSRQFDFKVHWTSGKNTKLADGMRSEIREYQAQIERNNSYMERKRSAPMGLVVNVKKPKVEGEEEDPEELEKERIEKEKEEQQSQIEDWVLMAENTRNQMRISGLMHSIQVTENTWI